MKRRKIKRWWKYYKAERAWKKAQKRDAHKRKTNMRKSRRKKSQSFFEKLLNYSPTSEIGFQNRKNRSKRRVKISGSRSSLFNHIWLIFKENRQISKEIKIHDKKIREALRFDHEDNKMIYSPSEKIKHFISTWKSLPWDLKRELENALTIFFVFFITFTFNFLVLQLVRFITAYFFHIPSSWSDGHLIFNIPDTSELWTYSSVISVYISGPISLLIIGITFMSLQKKLKAKNSIKSLFYLWAYFNAFVIFFGSFLAGIFTDRGFGFVFGWLYIPKYIEIPLGIISVFMIWIIGHLAGQKALHFIPKRALYKSQLPQFFSKCIYLYLPVFFAIICLFAIGFNDRDFTIQIIYLSILGMLTPTLRFIPKKIR